MALHGEIKVNQQPVGEWWAVRQQPVVVDNDQISEYACVVRLRETETETRFTVQHRYGDGAVALAAKVLMTAHAMTTAEPRRAL